MAPSSDDQHDGQHGSADQDEGAQRTTAPEEEPREDDFSDGDAEAAGSVEEREAIARDDDDTWETDPDTD